MHLPCSSVGDRYAITQIDIKTGKVLQQPNPETLHLEPKQKLVEHSYLEAWLKRHGLENAAFLRGSFTLEWMRPIG